MTGDVDYKSMRSYMNNFDPNDLLVVSKCHTLSFLDPRPSGASPVKYAATVVTEFLCVCICNLKLSVSELVCDTCIHCAISKNSLSDCMFPESQRTHCARQNQQKTNSKQLCHHVHILHNQANADRCEAKSKGTLVLLTLAPERTNSES